MIRINLLPHRALKRAAKKREFAVMAVGTVVFAGAVWYAGKLYLDERIAAQDRRNQLLSAEIKKLDAQIEEIKRLKEQTAALLARKQVVETLQVNRAASVKLLDQLARQLPEGVYLKSIKQTGNKVSLVGITQSNARVSSLMRNIESSPFLERPELVEIKAVTERNQRANEFTLNLYLKSHEGQTNAASGSTPRTAASTPAPTMREKVMQAITK
ncbi:MAG: PilN domain-containing protein [Casimicrobiaceae bacterium]|nr:PilN domain-containing protein [Casimicrobiaceae bacterium]MDW8311901.1 PilN domain-containing protein [Burkholderiales bacterium]